MVRARKPLKQVRKPLETTRKPPFACPETAPETAGNHPETPFCLPALFIVAWTSPGNHLFAYPETPFIVARNPLLPPPHKLMFAYFVAFFLDWGPWTSWGKRSHSFSHTQRASEVTPVPRSATVSEAKRGSSNAQVRNLSPAVSLTSSVSRLVNLRHRPDTLYSSLQCATAA